MGWGRARDSCPKGALDVVLVHAIAERGDTEGDVGAGGAVAVLHLQ